MPALSLALDADPVSLLTIVMTVLCGADASVSGWFAQMAGEFERGMLGDDMPPRGQARTRDAFRSVRAHLIAQVGADGWVHERCRSRILESALLLALASKTAAVPRTIAGNLSGYLRQARPAAFPDTVIVQAALGHRAEQAAEQLAQFRHFTGDRKRAVVSTLLALTGVTPLGPAVDVSGLSYRGYATWTELSLCAVKILHSQASGSDRDYLVSQLSGSGGGRVWEGNVLAHLIALHALHAFWPASPLIAEGVSALADQINSDGGLPFITGQEVFVTAMAGLCLAVVGAPAGLLTAMGDRLADAQHADGGWGFTRVTGQSDVDDTSRCVEFLRVADPRRYRAAIDSGCAYLVAMPDADGGFPTYIAGHPPEVDMTAGALVALASDRDRYLPLLRSSVRFLLAVQRSDGTFQTSWTLSEASVISRVLNAFHHVAPATAQRARRAVRRGVGRLAATQNPDGGWGQTPGQPSDVLSTAQAVPALHQHGARPAALRAMEFLLNQQRPDGTFSSIPDQVGPRPLPFDFPVLTNIHVISALAMSLSPREMT